MAKRFETVHIHVLVSFGDVKAGDLAHLERTPRVQGWIDAGLVEVLDDGESEAGQGAAEPADDERVEGGAEGSIPASGEPGQSFGAGPYGSPA
jgi:hypothetical protein